MPGVSEMPFYRSDFPKWAPSSMSKKFWTLSSSGLDLLGRCLCYTDRISATEALRHPWLSETIKTENL
jgi:serine/threonine protein kinase